MVRTEFRKHSEVTDPAQVEALRAAAVRGLSNYMMMDMGTKDPKTKKAFAASAARDVEGMER